MKKYRILFNIIFLTFTTILLGACAMEVTAEAKIDIRDPRFSPDGTSIIFDRCDTAYPDRCRIHTYNLKTGELGYYLPPAGQMWAQAFYAYAGDKITFVVSPTGDRNSDLYTQRHELLPKYQIATMNLDGSNMKVVTSMPGYKGMPAFSHSGDKIIFAQAETIRDSGKTLASFWDLWEVDLKTGQQYLFAGKYRFYQMGLSVYFPDDERVLVAGDVPVQNEALVGPKGVLAKSYEDFEKRYHSNYSYILKRGEKSPVEPLDVGLSHFYGPAMDDQGNLYGKGLVGKGGLEIYRVDKGGKKISFGRNPPISNEPATGLQGTVSHDGKLFLLPIMESSKNRKFMLLDIANTSWQELHFPQTARQINQ